MSLFLALSLMSFALPAVHMLASVLPHLMQTAPSLTVAMDMTVAQQWAQLLITALVGILTIVFGLKLGGRVVSYISKFAK